MIDKADFRIPAKARFTPEFQRGFREAFEGAVFGSQDASLKAKVERMSKKSQYYTQMLDMRAFGLPVALHMGCTMTKAGDHKLEIFEVGEKTLPEIKTLCSSIFDVDPDGLAVLRADLTADIPDVPVQWFKDNTYVSHKQTTREIGTVNPMPYMAIRKGQAETLYAGVKPNQNRIYDKTGERMARWQKMAMRLRRQNKDGALMENDFVPIDIPTFDQVYGYSPDKVITRVERQVAGRDLLKVEITNLRSLERCAVNDPFAKMKFFAQPDEDLTVERWGLLDWAAGMHLRTLVKERGLNEVRKFIQLCHGKNAPRTWNKFRPFISLDNVVGITSAQLRSSYQASSYAQIYPTQKAA